MEALLNKTLLSIEINTPGTDIIFITKETEEPIRYIAYGDCCSHSWVSNIETNVSIEIKDIRGKKIIKVEEMDMQHENHNEDYEYIKVYGYELTFEDDNKLFITYRNSSNGYYGGRLEKATFSNTNHRGETIQREPVTTAYINKAI